MNYLTNDLKIIIMSLRYAALEDHMNKKMTWEQMKEKYPNEWLLIFDYVTDDSGHIITGVVNRHSKNKNEVYKPLDTNKSAAFRYTGESSFSGLRSHAKQ